jgi:hypothetical protein
VRLVERQHVWVADEDEQRLRAKRIQKKME